MRNVKISAVNGALRIMALTVCVLVKQPTKNCWKTHEKR